MILNLNKIISKGSSLDLQTAGALLEEFDVAEVGTTRTEPSRGLNIVCTSFVNELCDLADFVLS